MVFSKRTNEPMVPVLYLDLDGTVRWGKDEIGHFVNDPRDIRIFDGVPELLKRYRNAGWRIVGVSNQGGVALGHITMQDCVSCMDATYNLSGQYFDKIIFCTHHPDADDLENAICWCRKPLAGMIIESALALGELTGEIYPPHLALMVGDRPEDAGAAENANIQFLDARRWRMGKHADEVLKGD